MLMRCSELSKIGWGQPFLSSLPQMSQDTGKFRENTKDQYYTQKGVAVHCVQRILELLPWAAAAHWIEPSAGKGVFVEAAKAAGVAVVEGLDIDPKAEGLL
jgi:hypothetical protein